MSKIQYRIVTDPSPLTGRPNYSPWLDIPSKKQLANYPGPVYINDCTPQSTEGIPAKVEWRLKP